MKLPILHVYELIQNLIAERDIPIFSCTSYIEQKKTR